MQGHAGHVRVGLGTGHRPAAVGGLSRQDCFQQSLAGGGAGGRVVAGIQGNQCPDRAVIALIGHIVQIAQTRHQVVAVNVGGILADGRQSQNHPGIVRGFGRMQPHGGRIDGLPDKFQSLLTVVLQAGHGQTRPSQTQHPPFAADGAYAGGTQALNVFSCGLIAAFGRDDGGFTGKSGLRRFQNPVVFHQQLLPGGQPVVGLPDGLQSLGIRRGG